MGIALRAGVSFCDVSGRLVFLDTIADRYFCLRPDTEQVFRQLMSTETVPPEIPALLSGGGLLCVTETVSALRPVSFKPPATGSLLDAPAARARLGQTVAALVRLRRARRALRTGGLHHLLFRLAQDKARLASASRDASATLEQLAPSFDGARKLVRSHDQCLPRSIALAGQCLANGLPVDLVIAVRLRPFAAHCWVQAGAWLVNDQVDVVRTYAPILVV